MLTYYTTYNNNKTYDINYYESIWTLWGWM
jgi:hypothetical protein